jgi:hypothetical protein
MTKAANFSVKIGWMISLIGVFIFFVPFPGAQKTAYGLFFLTGLLYTFLIQESISWEYRGKGKNMLKLVILIATHITPPLFVMAQAAILFLIFNKHGNAMEDKDASGNLPPILTTYNRAAFIIFITEMLALHVYVGKVMREGEHPSRLLKTMEDALIPAFLALGTLGCLFIGLLYTVITRYLTDG